MDVQVLGPLRIVVDGSALDLSGRYTAAALAYLTLFPARAVPLPEVAAAAGDTSGGVSTPAPLRRLRADLRHVSEVLPPTTLAVSSSVRLATPAGSVDSERFAELVREAQAAWATGAFTTCMTKSAAALALWRHDPYPELAGCLDAVPTVQRLRGQYLEALEMHQELTIDAGVDFNVLAQARQIAAMYPERRTFRLQLARALHLTGRHVEALAELRETSAVLGDSQLTRHITQLIAHRDPEVASVISIEGPSEPVAPRSSTGEKLRPVG